MNIYQNQSETADNNDSFIADCDEDLPDGKTDSDGFIEYWKNVLGTFGRVSA